MNNYFANINDITVHYKTNSAEPGSGNIPLVFINPLGTDLRVWDAVMPLLPSDSFILRYDKRGHGLTDAPAEEYNLALFSKDLMALLDYLAITECVLIGASIGGMVAMQTALNDPQRVKSLVLCDTAAKLGNADYWTERMNAVIEQGLTGMGEIILSRWFAPSFAKDRPVDYQGYSNMLVGNNLMGYVNSCAALRDADLRNEVVQLTQPTLVLCGAEDQASTPELVRAFASTLPNAEFALIPGAGHTVAVEAPQLLSVRIHQFLKEQHYV